MVMSAIFLTLLGVLWSDMTPDTISGKTILLTVPASIGAILAGTQMRQQEENEEDKQNASYGGELFIMAAGALLLAFNVAPTEEMVLIAYKMTEWHALLLALLTLLIMHAIVYTVGFKGQETGPEGARIWRLFYHFTIVGYAIALLVSLSVLWTFGRHEGSSLGMIAMATVVLAFPSGIGAALSSWWCSAWQSRTDDKADARPSARERRRPFGNARWPCWDCSWF
jgi:putative integral membrane protein (TIGR02587 family)